MAFPLPGIKTPLDPTSLPPHAEQDEPCRPVPFGQPYTQDVPSTDSTGPVLPGTTGGFENESAGADVEHDPEQSPPVLPAAQPALPADG